MGTLCSQETKYHVELCERLTQIIPSAEKVRLTNTGTEATMAAIRIARAATGREKVLKFEGHFHGMHDYVFYNAHTPTDRPYEPVVPPFPDSDGIPQVMGDLLVNVPFNDEKALLTALDEHAHEIACVILEPVSYNLGCVPADRDWLRLLRAETERRGIVLIFDEVLCGFRMGLGGAEEYFGVRPDLSTWAKALAAGWPLAAITGKAAVMDMLNPIGNTVVSGTYSGQLCCVLAALASLDVMSEPGFYEHINVVGSRLYAGLDRLLQENGLPGQVQALGARFCIYFGMRQRATDYRTACQFDAGLTRKFLEGCPPAGLHFHDFGSKMAPKHFGITSAHTEEIVDEALDRMRPIFRTLAAAPPAI
jgi:glutamate-1-semialdehyde 2,1-aminomutase